MKLGPLLVLALAFMMPGLVQAEPPAKAQRYLDMLRQRPQFGVVFDRFLDAWYEESTPDALGDQLAKDAAKPEAKAGDHLLLALFETRRGNEAAAVTAFKKGLALDPGNAPMWLELARLQVRMLDFTPALESLDQALKQKPDKTLTVNMEKLRGRVLLRTGKPADALAAWNTLLEAHADDEDLAEEVVEVQLDEGLYTEAVSLMKSLIGKTKDPYAKVTRRMRLADIYNRAGLKAEALEELAEVIRQSGHDTWIEGEALAQTDQIFRREDNLSGLAGHLEKLGAAEAQRVAVKRHLARVHAETGAKEQAFAIYRDLLERTPGRRDLREGYLDLLDRFENFTEAIPQTKLLIEQNPGDKELHLRLAAQQQRVGDTKSASASLDAYLGAPGTAEYDHMRVAMLLENWGRKEDARAAFAKLVAAFPTSTSAREAQAHFLHRNNERDAALAIWKDLAAKGDQEQVLAVSQALLARQEPKTAYEVLQSRLGDFGKDPRYLASLLTAAISIKEQKAVVPLAMERVRLTEDAGMLEDAIRQAVLVLDGAKAVPEAIKKLQGQSTPGISERCLLATLWEETGEKERAENTLREVVPGHALLAQTRLVGLIESRQDWPRAAQELEKLIAMPEGRTSQHLQRLVDLRLRSGEPEAALKMTLEWKTLSPGAVQPWLTEAQLLAQLNKAQEGIKILRAASRKFEDDENVAASLASAYVEAGQFGDAERIFMRLVENADSMDDKIRWVGALATAAQSRNALKDVTETFQERQRGNREDATPWLALAEIARVATNNTERRRCLLEAARLRPKDIDLLHQIARVEEDSGDFKQSIQTLEKAATLDTGWRTKQAIAMANLRAGDEDTGFRLLGELMGGSDIEPRDALRLADAMMARDHWEKAVAFLTPLVEKHPDDYRLRYQRAIALSVHGDNTAAIPDLLKVAAATQEVQDVLKKQLPRVIPAYEKTYVATLEKTAPPGAAGVYRTVRYIYDATQYKRRSQLGSSAPISGVRLPLDVGMARAYATIALMQIKAEEPAEVRARIAAALEEAGIEQARLLMAFEPNERASWSVMVPEEALLANPTDPLMHMFWVDYNGGNSESFLPLEHCQRAFNLLKEKYPIPAFRAAAAAMKTDSVAGLPMLEEALTRIEGLEDPTATLVSQVARMLGGGQNSTQTTQRLDLPEATKKKLRAAMVKGFLAPRTTPQAVDYNILYTSNACRADGAWEDYITLWNHQMKLFNTAEAAIQKQARAWGASRTQQSNLLRPLPFPTCEALPGLFSMMMRYTDPFNPQSQSYARPGPEDDYAAIVRLLDRVESPYMRIALAYKAGNRQRVEEELNARTSREDASLDDLLMAASYEGTAEHHDRVVTLLLRTQSLPMDAARRAEVDAALVHAVTNLKEKATRLFVEAGQQAARRLRSAKLDGRQRDELADAFASLGLKEEAEQWKRLAALAPAPTSQRSYSGGYSRQATRTRLDKVLAKGDHAEAIKAAISELRTVRAEYWIGNSSYAIQEGAGLIKKLTFPDAKAKLATALNPGDGASASRREEYASLLEIAGERDLAKKVYEDIIKRNPESYLSRIRLLAITARAEPDKAVTLLEAVPLKAFNQSLGTVITELCQDDNLPPAARMAMFSALSTVLERSAGDEAVRRLRAELDWMQELPALLSRRSYTGGSVMPYMFDRDPYADTNYNYMKPGVPELKLRRETMERLCKALMLHPRLAPSGFSWYAGLQLMEGKSPDGLATLANELLEKSRTHLSSGGPFTPLTPRRYSFYEEVTAVWRPQPAEFLVWHAWKHGRAQAIESEILPAVQPAMERSQFPVLRAQAKVWTCAPEEFGAAAEAFMRIAGGAAGNPSLRQTANAVWLVDRWQERKIPGPVLDKAMLSVIKNASGYNEGSYLHLYLKARRAMAPDADAAEFMKQMLITSLGAQEDRWAARMSTFANTRYGRGGSYNDRDAYNVGMILSVLAERMETKGVAARAAILTGLINHGDWVRNTLGRNFNDIGKNAELSIDFLKQSEFLNEAATIRVVNEQNMVHSLFSTARQTPESRKTLAEALKGVELRTFGVNLAEALLQQNVDAALTAFIKSHKAEFATVPQDRIQGLASLIKLNVPATKNLNTLDPSLKEAWQPIFAGELAEQQSLTDKWMASKKKQDLSLDDERYEQELERVFIELSASDPKKAAEFFNHACKLMEAKEATEEWNTYAAGNGWTLRSEILSRAMRNSPKMRMLALSMRLFQDDTSGNLTMHGWSHDSKWGQCLHEAWKNAGGAASASRGLEAMLTALQKELGDTPHTLLPLAFYDFYNRLPAGQRVPTLQWAAKPTGDASLAPLAKELALAGRFFLATETGARTNAEMQKALAELGGVEPVWQHETTRLRDEKLNPRARLAFALHLCYRAPASIPADIASTSAQLALDAQRQMHCMHGYQYGWILQAWSRQPADDAWKNLAQAHWSAWLARNARKSQSQSLLYEPHAWPILNVLRMAAHAGNEGWISEIQSSFSGRLNNDPSCMAILAEEGLIKEAVGWARANWPSLLNACDDNLKWNVGVARAVTQLQASGAEPDLAFTCEVLLSNMKDPAKPDQAAIPNYMDRRKRMLELAKRMKGITFANVEMKRACLEEFGQHYFCYEPLGAAFDEAAAAVDMAALGQSQNPQEHFKKLKPVVASAGRRLWNGDAKPAIDFYDKAMGTDKTAHAFYRQSLARNAVWDVLWSGPYKWSSQKEPDRAPLLALVDHILTKTPDELFSQHVADAVALKILIPHLQGHPEAVTEWRKTLTVDRAQKLKREFTNHFRVWAYFDTMNLDAKMRTKTEARAALVGALLQDEWIRELYPETGANLTNLIVTLVNKDKAFKPDELLAAWKPIAEAFPRKGRTAGESADLLMQRGLLDDALAAFDLAISQTAADYAASAGFICRKAELLERLNRKEDALAALHALDEKKMGPGAKTQRAALLRRLQGGAKTGT